MHKIKKASHLLFLLFQSLVWLVPLITAYLILFQMEWMLHWGVWSDVIDMSRMKQGFNFSLTHRGFILLAQLLPLSITVLIFQQLARLFHLYERGFLFDEENIILIHKIGMYMLLGEVVHFIYQPLLCLAFSINNPVGERFISFSIGSTNFSNAIIGLIILMASWIVKEANQLKNDAQLTI